MAFDGYDSPSTVDAPLEYITVENYSWPKPTPVKRRRVDEHERRRRHCECQKRFLARKRQQFEQLRKAARVLELQVKYLETVRKAKSLEMEQAQLMKITERSKSVDTWEITQSTDLEVTSLGRQENELFLIDQGDILDVLDLEW